MSRSSKFFTAKNIVMRILQQVIIKAGEITAQDLNYLKLFQNNFSTFEVADKISYVNNIIAVCLASENSHYSYLYKNLLEDIFEEGIQAIFTKANKANAKLEENEIKIILYYHQNLKNKTDAILADANDWDMLESKDDSRIEVHQDIKSKINEEIIRQYIRICHAFKNGGMQNHEETYTKLHNNLYMAHESLLEGVAEQLDPSPEEQMRRMKLSFQFSPFTA